MAVRQIVWAEALAAAVGIAASALPVPLRGAGDADSGSGSPWSQALPVQASTLEADDGVLLNVTEIDPAVTGPVDVTVIGVHGFALSSAGWCLQHRHLAALEAPRVRQVYYDHRSHGRSGRADARSCTIEQLAGDLSAVIREYAGGGHVVLAGHSMGGMVIMELARREPHLFAETVAGVSLIATAAGGVARAGVPRPVLSRYNPLTRAVVDLAAWQPNLVELARSASGVLSRRAVRRLAFGTRTPSPALMDLAVDMLQSNRVSELTKFLPTFSAHDCYEALAPLAQAQVQVIGADADVMIPYSHTLRIAAELPDAELVRVPGAGHLVQLEYAEVVNNHLIALIRRVAADAGLTGPGSIGGLPARWRRDLAG